MTISTATVIIAMVGAMLIIGLVLFVSKKKLSSGSTDVEDSAPVLMMTAIMLALTLCQETLVRLRRTSPDMAEEEMAKIIFDEVYSYIIHNSECFNPTAIQYIMKIDRDQLARISSAVVIQFVKQIDKLITDKK